MRIFKYALALAALVATPGMLAAQACAGTALGSGQGFLETGVGFTDGAFGYGVAGGGMTRGGLILGARLSRVEFDNTDIGENQVAGSAGVEVPNDEFSLCPTVSVGYSWLTGLDGADVDGLTFAGGMGIGKSFGEGELLLTPYGAASVQHIRASASSGGLSGTDSETGGVFAAGLNVGNETFWAGPSVTVSTFDGSDPTLGVQAGFAF